jgi:hypothetical protein
MQHQRCPWLLYVLSCCNNMNATRFTPSGRDMAADGDEEAVVRTVCAAGYLH